MLCGNDLSLENGVGCVLDTNSSLLVVKKDADNLGLHKNVEVGVFAVFDLVMNVSSGSVLSSAILGDVSEPALDTVVVI